MDARIKGLWVEKLRSGEYPQGTQYLNKDDREFCCLGVLCEIGVAEGDLTRATGPEENLIYYKEPEQDEWDAGYFAGLPENFANKVGVLSSMGHRPNGEIALYILNDSGTSFAEIADIIEEEF